MRYKPTSVWETPGLKKDLIKLASSGTNSGAVIAAKLSEKYNLTITRNAVMGALFRNRVSLSGPPLKPIAKPKPTPLRVSQAQPKPVTIEPEPGPIGDVDEGCRYLHGDVKNRNFCGARLVSDGSSWCRYHSALIFSPQSPSDTRKAIKHYMRGAA